MRAPKVIAADRPLLPDGARYLWEWFCEISMGLSSNGMGPPGLTWESLLAWRCQMGVDPEPWESRALVRLGSLRVEVLSEQKPKPDPRPTPDSKKRKQHGDPNAIR